MTKQPTPGALKKRLYRAERYRKGWREVSVWVAEEQATTLRAYAESLPPPARGHAADPNQLELPLGRGNR